jgi:aspartate racemase
VPVIVANGTRARRPIWGVIGGMGPLASAEFVRTIYAVRPSTREQDAPVVLLLSDPTVPDRTDALTNGGDSLLRACLSTSIGTLLSMGSTRIVICCVTAHQLLSEIEAPLRCKVMSLIDVLLSAARADTSRHLLLCSNGSRAARLFEQHPLWPEVADRMVLPSAGDQHAIHAMIYRLKAGSPAARELPRVAALLERYGVSSFAAGCTELHLVRRCLSQDDGMPSPVTCIDPLQLVAETIAAAE